MLYLTVLFICTSTSTLLAESDGKTEKLEKNFKYQNAKRDLDLDNEPPQELSIQSEYGKMVNKKMYDILYSSESEQGIQVRQRSNKQLGWER